MNCPVCQSKSAARANYCWKCGSPLGEVARCPDCTTPLVPGADFCYRCGRALGVASAASRETLSKYIPPELLAKLESARSGGAMEGERRVVTMLFCDVRGSTAMAEKLDPEEWAEIMKGIFGDLIKPVYQYEGTLARLMGDAILAFFGAPIAHEDDPQRAALAGLAIVSGIQEQKQRILDEWGMTIDVRVGINTGLVVVGEVGSDLRVEYTAMGDAVNLAARMEQTAQPGTVQVAEATYALIAPYFEVESLGGIEVKGKSERVPAYRVIRAADKPGSARGLEGLTAPVIGRDAELKTLRGVLDSLKNGQGRIVTITGEAGIGKSRLIAEMRSGWDGAWIQTASVSYTALRPYAALQAHLRTQCLIAEGDSLDLVRKKFQRYASGPDPLLEEVLGFHREGADLKDGEAFRKALHQAALRAEPSSSTSQPTVIVLDDAHWMDAASAEVFNEYLGLVADGSPLCMVIVTRPDEASAGWAIVQKAGQEFADYTTRLDLSPLHETDSRALVRSLLANLPDNLSAPILARAEGNPFYIEEVIRTLIDHHDLVYQNGGWIAPGGAGDLPIPGNLRSLLTARIDRLDEPSRRVLQVAAVIGRDFSADVLGQVAQNGDLASKLAALEQHDLIDTISTRDYVFRHGLIQEAAYASILIKRRRELHQQIGTVLEGDPVSADPSLLGFHFFEAQDYQRAAPYYSEAGDQAARLYANTEAALDYGRAIEAYHKAKDETAPLADLYLRRGGALSVTADYPGVLACYQEAEAIAEKRGDEAMLLAAVLAHATVRATPTPLYDAAIARKLLNRARDMAQKLGDRASEAKILWNLMLLATFSDEPGKVVEYGEQALEIARELGLKEQIAFTLNDLNRAYRAVGDLTRAKEVLDESRPLWRELDHKAMLTDNLGGSAYLYFMIGDLDAAYAFGEEGYRISAETGNLWGKALNHSGMSFVLFERGQIQEGIDALKESLAVAASFNMAVALSAVRADLAWMLAAVGQVEQSTALADQALKVLAESELPPVFIAWAWASVALMRAYNGDLDGVDAALASMPSGSGSDELGSQAPMYAARAKAMTQLARGDTAEALETAESIEGRVREWRADGALPEVLLIKGRALAALGKLDAARDALNEARRCAADQSARRTGYEIALELASVEARRGDDSARREAQVEADKLAAFIDEHITDPAIREGFRKRLAALQDLREK